MKLNKVTIACELARQNTTQTEIAKKCGLHFKTVNKAYNGSSCSQKTARLIADTLGISLNSMVVLDE